MSTTIRLVQNDTAPTLYVALIDDVTELPVDISLATQVRMLFRAVGATALTDTLTGTLLPGIVNPDGSITTNGPGATGYATAGSGGRVSFIWHPTTLATPGQFEGELQITFSDGTIQTVYDPLRFFIRASF